MAGVCLAIALLTIAVGLDAPSPRRVNIRWADNATLAERVMAAQSLGIRPILSPEDRTWSYEVPDAALIPAILQHPLVADTHHIDRDRLTFSPELPPARAQWRWLYESTPLGGIADHWRLLSALLILFAVVPGWPWIRSLCTARPERVLLAFVLAVSLVARVVLVMNGGQFFWPDEDRYKQSREMIDEIAAGHADAAWARAIKSGHPLFKISGMVPAEFESTFGRDPHVPALFFALFSVLNVWLMERVARRFGAGPVESLLVAVVFASSASYLYYSRHLVPYDVAMTCGLLSLSAAAGSRWKASLACGILAALTFLTYFGYWTFAAAACVVHIVGARSLPDGSRRVAVVAVGLAIPLLIVLGTTIWIDPALMADVRAFSAQVAQGSFAEGWRLPLEYLWHSEHALLLLWLACATWCLLTPASLANPRVRAGLAGLFVVYASLALLSTGLERFVVYGRLARQLVPFFCLMTAAALMQWTARRSAFQHVALPITAAAVVIVAALNASRPFAQRFPLEFIAEEEQIAGRLGAPSAASLYTDYAYPPVRLEMPPGQYEVGSASHPLQYLPYQYEGFTPEERQFLRSTDIRMRIVSPVGVAR